MERPVFIDALAAALAAPLPGREAQERMLPGFRRGASDPSESSGRPWREAAVLILLYPDGTGGYGFPLVERGLEVRHHRGEMGLPGGAVEPGESSREAAVREAREELCLDYEAAQGIELIGALSPLRVPSGFSVSPFVGWLDYRPAMAPRPGEIAAIVEASVGALGSPSCVDTVSTEFAGSTWSVPAFGLAGRAVWGATAMVLAEFAALLCAVERDGARNAEAEP